ncbi:MAG: RHS repeat-associated core domain-containing protein [Oligosphaeraceae bacterium]
MGFAYDYLGRRFEKKVYENGVLVKHRLFVHDGFQGVAEYDALDGNALLHTCLWQPGEDRTPLLFDRNRLYVTDASRNVVALLDPAGEATDTYLYDPFGNVIHAGASPNPIQFSSETFDEETGLVYYNYRCYNPKMGRWIKRDPIGEQGGVNLYAFWQTVRFIALMN